MSACPRPAPAPAIDRQAAILSRRLSLALILCTGAAPAPASGTDPGLWVLALNRQLTQQFGAAGLSAQERARRFAAILDADLDTEALGSLTLGQRWPAATDDERREFGRDLRRFLVHGLAGHVRGFGEHALLVRAVFADGQATIVETDLAAGQMPPVRWRLMPQAGGWRLSDIVISGISFAAVLQAQFAGVLRTRGGGLPALLAVLRAHGEG